jgi:ribonuclease G
LASRKNSALARRVASTGSVFGRRHGRWFILRTNGEDATDIELAEDIAYLRKQASYQAGFPCVPAASVLHQDLSLLQRVAIWLENTQTIRIDSA